MSKSCKKCGSEIPEESKFCLNCGEKVEKNKSNSKVEKKKILPFVIGGGIAVVVLAIVTVLVVILGGNSFDGGTDGNKNSNDTNNKDSNSELKNQENNNDNNLTCSGKTSLMFDILLGKVDGSDEYTSVAAVDQSKDYIENGEYTFVYDNDVLTSIKAKETFKKSFGDEMTDEMIKEAEEEGVKVSKDSNNKVIFEYTLNKNDELTKGLGTKNNLKVWLENNTNLTCNGKSNSSSVSKDNNDSKNTETKNDNNDSNNTETKKDITLKCSGKVYYAYEEYNFNFKYDTSKKDYSLDSIHNYLTIPDEYDAKDYYTEEQISNMGKYEMSLNGRIITFKLDKTRAYWDDYYYKDYSYDEFKKKYTNDGYVCE